MRTPNIRRILAGAMVTAVGIAGLSPLADADAEVTATETDQFDLGDLDLSGSGSFEQFDPALGKLRAVHLTASADMQFEVCMTNLSDDASTIPAGLASGDVPVEFAGDIVANLEGDTPVPEFTASANQGGDPCQDWLDNGTEPSSTDSVRFSASLDDTWSRTVTNATKLKPYIGTGQVDYDYAASSASNLGQPSEWTIIFLASGAGEVSIRYEYDAEGTGPDKAQPIVRTSAANRVLMKVRPDGSVAPVTLRDTIRIRDFRSGGTATGKATLFGPVDRLSSKMCTRANRVGSVSFQPRNGEFRSPGITVTEPGIYTWVVRITGDTRNEPAGHGCGLASESTMVRRPPTPPVDIETGVNADGEIVRTSSLPRLTIPALNISAPVVTVGKVGTRMAVPGDVHKVGWYRPTARPGEEIGTSVIAGHVSDEHDRPGALWRLKNARRGQTINVGRQSYRISKVYTRPRSEDLAKDLFATTGAHRLVLVTCTGKRTNPDGTFHYTKRLIVIAKHVS